MPPKNGIKILWEEFRTAILTELEGRQFATKLLGWGRSAIAAGAKLTQLHEVMRNNFELGVRHYEQGNLEDAILRLSIVIWLQPKHAVAWYVLGLSYMSLDKKRDAKKAFTRALKLRPDWADARTMLDAVNANAASI